LAPIAGGDKVKKEIYAIWETFEVHACSTRQDFGDPRIARPRAAPSGSELVEAAPAAARRRETTSLPEPIAVIARRSRSRASHPFARGSPARNFSGNRSRKRTSGRPSRDGRPEV
jgi:hypothetical protein